MHYPLDPPDLPSPVPGQVTAARLAITGVTGVVPRHRPTRTSDGMGERFDFSVHRGAVSYAFGVTITGVRTGDRRPVATIREGAVREAGGSLVGGLCLALSAAGFRVVRE